MPGLIAAVLSNYAFSTIARMLLTFPFWACAIMEAIAFSSNALAMQGLGLHPGWAFNLVTLSFQLVMSLMIILDLAVWLAAGGLGIFTLLTIPIAHAFWLKHGEEAFHDMTMAMEHVSLVAGLALAAILSHARRSAQRTLSVEPPTGLVSSARGSAFST